MNEERCKKFIGKKAIIFLKGMQRQYTADIISVTSGTMEIKDKYNNEIPIDCEMIGLIEELTDGDKDSKFHE